MKKKSGTEISPIEVDPISGHYYIVIPEWMINELSWYEDTNVALSIEGNEIVLKEHEED